MNNKEKMCALLEQGWFYKEDTDRWFPPVDMTLTGGEIKAMQNESFSSGLTLEQAWEVFDGYAK